MIEEEKIQVIDQYLNERGIWRDFKSWVESQGYSMSELGFEDED